MSVPTIPVPPAAKTTAAEAGITTVPDEVVPRRPDLTTRAGAAADGGPRPATLATQELRLALAFTGGVSLAVWMGGVARELDLLVQASAQRRPRDPLPQPEERGHARRLRDRYQRLLELMDVQAGVDVLAGTSAGGINAALLGLTGARRLGLGALRDIWLEAGDVGRLLRDPGEPAPPSLLRGDDQMLTALNSGIRAILRGQEEVPEPRRTDVFITTTLLAPEIGRFTDDYGTQIGDTDHHALFHFDERTLAGDIAAPLALAARSSASFPGAFEPSFVPVGRGAAGELDDLHPDMAPYVDATRSHWAADGGLLVNRPIAPVLQTIFDREGDRHVRRALLYVVPSSVPAAAPPECRRSRPPDLAAALLADLSATMNQSIAADLAAIKEHNDRVRAMADTRLRLAVLAGRLGDGGLLTDPGAWADYRRRQGNWLVAPLLAEIARQLPTLWPEGAEGPFLPGTDQMEALRSAAVDAVTARWPARPPGTEAEAVEAAVALGRPAFDAAKATVLRLVRLGYTLAGTVDDRQAFAHAAMFVLRPLSETRQTQLGSFVRTHLGPATSHGSIAALPGDVAELATAYARMQGSEDELRAAWRELTRVVTLVADRLRRLARDAVAADRPAPDGARPSASQQRAAAGEEIRSYLAVLGGPEPVRMLLDLHVAVRSVLPVLQEVEQFVELIQVSADTRSGLAPSHPTAASKLTGLQVHHFGAFYKRSWRANDWMWGRLDGCGWLVHLLLDPRRILAVLENDGVPVGRRAETFTGRMAESFGRPVPGEHRAALRFLDDETLPVPPSLPGLAMWLAEVLQGDIATEELRVVAAEVRKEGGRAQWLRDFDAWAAQEQPSREETGRVLDSCPVAGETLREEARRRTPLFLRTATRAAAVATAAGTGMREPPRSLRPTFATARAVTRTAYQAVDRSSGRRGPMVLTGLALLACGVLALLTDITLLGMTGVVACTTGALVLALSLGPGAAGALRTLALLAALLLGAAPWLPWLRTRLFSGLDAAVGAVQDHPWAWPVVLFLLLLPPLTVVADLAGKLRPVRRRGKPGAAATAPGDRPSQRPGAPGRSDPHDRERGEQGGEDQAVHQRQAHRHGEHPDQRDYVNSARPPAHDAGPRQPGVEQQQAEKAQHRDVAPR
ncbi:patatin-like protein [Nucisporomicrobium flavum]|uniref:patatin-like protein n=1 Tax=Nucisporomicrobium flavum TaxID=2785915 RepID=UPI0018F47EBB|nr:patatin-like protein [Nucisporomicrobium flavum]